MESTLGQDHSSDGDPGKGGRSRTDPATHNRLRRLARRRGAEDRHPPIPGSRTAARSPRPPHPFPFPPPLWLRQGQLDTRPPQRGVCLFFENSELLSEVRKNKFCHLTRICREAHWRGPRSVLKGLHLVAQSSQVSGNLDSQRTCLVGLPSLAGSSNASLF